MTFFILYILLKQEQNEQCFVVSSRSFSDMIGNAYKPIHVKGSMTSLCVIENYNWCRKYKFHKPHDSYFMWTKLFDPEPICFTQTIKNKLYVFFSHNGRDATAKCASWSFLRKKLDLTWKFSAILNELRLKAINIYSLIFLSV